MEHLQGKNGAKTQKEEESHNGTHQHVHKRHNKEDSVAINWKETMHQ